MELQPVVGFAWFAAGVVLLVCGVAGAIWAMWRAAVDQGVGRAVASGVTVRTAAARAVTVAVVMALGAGMVAHSRIRTWQGRWWGLAPTEVLVRASSLEGARAALGPRLWNRGGSGPARAAWFEGALSERQWRLLADGRRRVALDPRRPGPERSTAAIDLGALIPDPGIVDPILAELLESEDCSSRRLGALGATMYNDHRSIPKPSWLNELERLACDPSCLELAQQSAFILAQTRPLPREHLRRVVAAIKGRPELEDVWRGLGRGLGQGGGLDVQEARLAFLAELQSSGDPEVLAGVAIMRPLVEAGPASIMYRLRVNQNG